MSRHHSSRRGKRQFGFVIRNLYDSMLKMRFRSSMLMQSFLCKNEKKKKNYFNFPKCILLWQNRYGLIGPWKFDFFFFLFFHFYPFLEYAYGIEKYKNISFQLYFYTCFCWNTYYSLESLYFQTWRFIMVVLFLKGYSIPACFSRVYCKCIKKV